MVAIQWPLSTSPGERPQEGAGRLINCFAEPRGNDLGPAWHRMPGASVFGEDEVNEEWTWWSLWEYFVGPAQPIPPLDGAFRGGVVVGDTLWAVLGERIYTFNRNGDHTNVGPLAGEDKIFIARNNKSPTPDIAAVTGQGAFVITVAGAAAYPDVDVGSPNSVAVHDGWFMFTYGSGRIQASDLNDTAINTLNRAAAESNPDGLTRGWSYEGYYYAAGPATIEVFGPPVNDTGFPYNRVGYHITPGLLAAHAVAGFEPEFGYPPMYVATNRTVQRLRGTEAEKISPADLDRLIAAVTDHDGIDCLIYAVEGVPWFQVNGPGFSWAFNLNTEKWSELVSEGLTRSRRTGSVYAFDQWLVGDTLEGQLLIPDNSEEEAGEVFLFWIESLDVEDFPTRTRVISADFNFTVGVGRAGGRDPIEVNPTARISYSNDGGRTWSTPYNRALGQQAQSKKRVTIGPSGLTGVQGRRWRVQVSDPVHVGVLGATQNQKLNRDRRRAP